MAKRLLNDVQRHHRTGGKAGAYHCPLPRIRPDVRIFKLVRGSGCRGFNLEEAAMISITRLVIAAAAVFALAALRPVHEDVKPTDLGKGAEFEGKKIEMKDKGEVAYLLSFTAGKKFNATTDGTKDTDF